MPKGESVNWKAMTRILALSALFYLGTLGGVLAWVDRTKLDTELFQTTTEDIRWIRECMVKKCWDKP